MADIGVHKARAVKGSEQSTVDSGGNLMLAVDMCLLDSGENVTITLSFAGKAPEYSIKKLRMLGWVGDDIDNLEGIDRNEVEVRIFEDIFEGKPRRKAELVFGGGAFKFENQLDARQKKSFAAQFKNLAKTIPAKGVAASGGKSASREPGDDTDDLNF